MDGMSDTKSLPAPMSDARIEELLIILGEECSEVIKEVSKTYRFTLDSANPKDNTTPRQRLTTELGDVMCVMKMLVDGGVIKQDEVFAAAHEKKPRVLALLKSPA